MDAILSIKPKYVVLMTSGDKKYEFRKVIFKNRNINYIYIYSSAPVKKIVGAFKIGAIVENQPDILWKTLGESSGLDKHEFFNYFGDNKRGFAIEIKDLEIFENPLDSAFIPDFVPPQNFCYLNGSSARILRALSSKADQNSPLKSQNNLYKMGTRQISFPTD